LPTTRVKLLTHSFKSKNVVTGNITYQTQPAINPMVWLLRVI